MKAGKGFVKNKISVISSVSLAIEVCSALVSDIIGNIGRGRASLCLGKNGFPFQASSTQPSLNLGSYRIYQTNYIHARNKLVAVSTTPTSSSENGTELPLPQIHYEDPYGILLPPEPLRSLPLHETLHPFGKDRPFSVTRIATDPDMFLVRNFLPLQKERQALMATEDTMEYAGTKTKGVTEHRKNSFVTWIDPEDEREEVQKVASYLRNISSYFFLPSYHPDTLPTPSYIPEKLQLVKYSPGGKFDLHCDGYHRFLTVITYLNGVAGTWFPYALVGEDGEQDNPPLMTEGISLEKTPGSDGVVLSTEGEESVHLKKLHPGDAVVFYSYRFLDSEGAILNGDRMAMNWRSLHAGLETSTEKWIATNWFRCQFEGENQ